MDELGPLVWKYPLVPNPDRYIQFLYSLGILSVSFPLGYGLYRGLYARQYYGWVAVVFWSRMWLMLAILAISIFLYLLVRHWRRKRRFVAVHKNGIKLYLSKPIHLKWSQIHGIAYQESQTKFLKNPLRKRFRASLYATTGPVIKIDPDLQDLPDLVSRIKAATYPRLFDELSENFRDGKWLFFGPLAIQKHLIRNRKRDIPWNSIEKIDVRKGSLMIEMQKGTHLRIPLIKIPNFELLLEIIQKWVAN